MSDAVTETISRDQQRPVDRAASVNVPRRLRNLELVLVLFASGINGGALYLVQLGAIGAFDSSFFLPATGLAVLTFRSARANPLAFCTAWTPSASALTRRTMSSWATVPVNPWSASHWGSPQLAGPMSRRCPPDQAMASVISRTWSLGL